MDSHRNGLERALSAPDRRRRGAGLRIAPGFGSSKSSPTNQLLLQGLPASGVGVLAFDFPLHGESPDGTPPLWLETCFDALAAAEARLQADGSVVLGEEYGSVRPLKLTRGFFEDLDRHDLFPLWRPEEAEVRMVHVELDETIPVEEARRFAVRFQIPLTVIPGGDHRLSIPGAPELVLERAPAFFLGRS